MSTYEKVLFVLTPVSLVFFFIYRTNHLDESIALLEELAIAATPTNTRLRSEIASASSAYTNTTNASSLSSTSASSTPASTPASTPSSALTTTTATTSPPPSSLLFLQKIQDESLLPIYPQLKDFPIVYTKTWELEDEPARRLLLRLCHSSPSSSSSSKHPKSSSSSTEADDKDVEEDGKTSIFPMHMEDKRRARYQKSLRNTAIKWKGEHSQGYRGKDEKGFVIGERRLKELDRDSGKRGADHRRSFKGPRF